MYSNFTIVCPHCKKLNDFTGDDWQDELIDDSCTHHIDCLHCGKVLHIVVNAIYSLELDDEEDYDEGEEGAV